jgi:heat-inducible transcriptional repressor
LNPSQRKQRILAAVVELYNETGEPVGSKRLMEALPDDISSATIRNEMAQLAELGFLEQPHTSAGRIPSARGYRYYIDNLLPLRELPEAQRLKLEAELHARAKEPERLLENAGRLLAELTACTALCVPAAGEQVRVRRIEIAPLGRTMAMLALLTSGGAVKSKVIRTDAPLTPEALEAFARLAKEQMLGMPLASFTQAGLQSLAAKAGAQFWAVAPLLAGVAELAEAAAGGEMLVGEANLYHHPQLEHSANALLQYLQSAGLSQLIRRDQRLPQEPQQSIRVLLGGESPAHPPALQGATLVIAPYVIGGAQGGLLGVIGPLRMDYARVTPGLRFIAALLGKILDQGLDE